MTRFEIAKEALQAVVVVGAVVALFIHPSMRDGWRPGRRVLSWAVVFFFLLHAVAQLVTRDQYRYPQKGELFPFTRWAMFAGISTDVETTSVYEWRGVMRSGDAKALNPARMFVTPNATVLFTKTQSLADSYQQPGAEDRARARIALDAFARGLMNRHDALHPNAPLESVELWQRNVPMKPGSLVPAPFSPGACRLIVKFSRDRQ
jgi:hypothetical protein